MLPTFVATYQHALDDKGRLSIPRKFLEVLESRREDQLWAFPGVRKFVLLYPLAEYQAYRERVERTPMEPAEADSFERFLCSQTKVLQVDKPGRILLPREFRELAEIDDQVVLVGARDHIELWSPANWSEQLGQDRDRYQQKAASIVRA